MGERKRVTGWSVDVLVDLAHNAAAIGCEVLDLDDSVGITVQRPRSNRYALAERGMLMMLGLAGSWMHSGLPAVLPVSSTLAKLTTADPQRRPRSPWRAWLIVLPVGQAEVSLQRSDGPIDPIRALIVVSVREQWAYFGLGGRVEYSEVGRTAEQLADLSWDDGLVCAVGADLIETTEHDRAAVRKMRRLILNTSLALDEIDGVRRIGLERGARDRGRLPAGDYVIEAYCG
jgi:hypothetical protein